MFDLPLADELFLVGHDQYTGKPHISDGALDTALAGAVLGELVLVGRIAIDENTIVVVRNERPRRDRVCDTALAEIRRQHQPHPVRAWVEYLREHARMMVAPRLVHSGMIEQRQVRTLLRQVVRYKAVDPIKAASPQARLRYMLDHPGTVDEQTAVLASLVLASSLEFVLGGLSARQTRNGLGQMQGTLRADLLALTAGVESAIAQLTLSGHR